MSAILCLTLLSTSGRLTYIRAALEMNSPEHD